MPGCDANYSFPITSEYQYLIGHLIRHTVRKRAAVCEFTANMKVSIDYKNNLQRQRSVILSFCLTTCRSEYRRVAIFKHVDLDIRDVLNVTNLFAVITCLLDAQFV